jgi:hypothetical protein
LPFGEISLAFVFAIWQYLFMPDRSRMESQMLTEIQLACLLFAAPSILVGTIFVIGSYVFGGQQ